MEAAIVASSEDAGGVRAMRVHYGRRTLAFFGCEGHVSVAWACTETPAAAVGSLPWPRTPQECRLLADFIGLDG